MREQSGRQQCNDRDDHKHHETDGRTRTGKESTCEIHRPSSTKALLILEEGEGPAGGAPRVNVAYGYAVIRLAARLAQALPEWRAHPLVAGLEFSNKWVCGWLRRAGLRRRRVTSVEKVPPPAAAVDARMREIQARIVAGGFAPCDVRSADETGVWYGAAPKNQYVAAGTRRGVAPPSDDRARFTAHLNGAADGTMHAPFFIVRCAAVGPDLSGTRVLQGLRDAGGFGAAAGWSLREWRRVLTTRDRAGKPTTAEHVRPYLVHGPTGAVVTLNATAWMRTPEMCMWADVQLAPQQASSGRRMLVVVDNCGAHLTPTTEAVFREHGIALEALPKNMTDALQVMDLVVNGSRPCSAAAAAGPCSRRSRRTACAWSRRPLPTAAAPRRSGRRPSRASPTACTPSATRTPWTLRPQPSARACGAAS